MARTVEEVEADLARLAQRRASGVVQTTFGDMSVRYVDGTNDVSLEASLRAELASLQGAPLTTRMSFTRIGMRRC